MNKDEKKLIEINYIKQGIELGFIKEVFTDNACYKRWKVIKPFIFIFRKERSKYKKGEYIGHPIPTEELYKRRELRYKEFLIDIIKGLSNDYNNL